MRRLVAVACAVIAAQLAFPAVATAWDQTANIKDAAARLGKLHRREGSAGVLKFLDACYRTHILASTFTQGLEACMAQDYMHSRVLAEIYARVPEADRKKLNVPSPEFIAKSIGERFLAAFAQYKVPMSEVEKFKRTVDKYGFPVFLKAVFPNIDRNNANKPTEAPQ